MSRKITLPPYEQMLLQMGSFSAEQLDNVVKCAKVRLAQMQPKAARKAKKRAEEPLLDRAERAS